MEKQSKPRCWWLLQVYFLFWYVNTQVQRLNLVPVKLIRLDEGQIYWTIAKQFVDETAQMVQKVDSIITNDHN